VDLGHRFTEAWHGNAAFSYARTLDYIYWAPLGAAMWQPRNFSGWDNLWEAKLMTQYVSAQGWLQKLEFSLQNTGALAQTLQRLGTRHESNWLNGRLNLAIESAIHFANLGTFQKLGGSTGPSGLDWVGDWQLSYHLDPKWELYVSGNNWHIVPVQEPSAGYFARASLISAGIKAQF
jgi:hypothetical protein